VSCGQSGREIELTCTGLRASLYNAVGVEAVEALCEYIRTFS